MALDKEARHKRADISDLVCMTFMMSGKGYQQHGDVRYCDVITIGCQTSHGGLLRRSGQKTGENAFNVGPLVVRFFEKPSPIVDMTPNRSTPRPGELGKSSLYLSRC